MTTRDIRPSTAHTVCDVCGRTLLRGERAEAYVHGGARRWVCELCKSRALNEGWVREGTAPAYEEGTAGSERRRSLFSRLRARRDGPPPAEVGSSLEREGEDGGPAAVGGRPDQAPLNSGSLLRRERPREPRHVRAIPTSTEQKIASAIDLFNSSEHPRTVSGVARSLGLPAVAVSPSAVRPSLVNVVASWELCWYRYEVDLSDEVPGVRIAAQGYELDELTPEERHPNALADDRGLLSMGG